MSVFDPEPYASILDDQLRESARRAVARARDLNWPLFLVLQRIGSDGAVFLGCSLHSRFLEFLSSCVDFAFPRGRFKTSPGGAEEFPEIADAELRGAIESLVSRVDELGLLYFIGLRVPEAPGATKLDLFRKSRLPEQIKTHLHLCFETAIFANHAAGSEGQCSSFVN